MARLCERPGCSQPADVTYGIDADHLTVWIEPFDGAVAYRAGVLCRRHADAMVVPLGWMLDDRREAVPRLFKPREAPTPAKVRARRSRHHTSRDETGQLDLAPAGNDVEHAPAAVAVVVAAVEPVDGGPIAVPVAEVSDEPVAPWKPVFDQSDDLDGLLQARSPLLSRAFGKRDRTPPS